MSCKLYARSNALEVPAIPNVRSHFVPSATLPASPDARMPGSKHANTPITPSRKTAEKDSRILQENRREAEEKESLRERR
jgi:hypothetical protein